MNVVKNDVTKATGNLQLCGGQDEGCEATNSYFCAQRLQYGTLTICNWW